MTAVIIDDEPNSHLNLREKLNLHHPEIELIGAAYNVAEGKVLIEQNQPELVFLDIEMPDGTGFDLIARLKERNFNLIFVTAFNQYAQTAIRLGALDYLHKPVNSLELSNAILRAQLQQARQIQSQQLQIIQETLERLETKRLPERISISTSEGVLYFPTASIIRLEAMQNFTEFKLEDTKRRLIASHNLKKYEQDLKPYSQFMRIHKSYLIHLLRVIRLIKGEKAYVEMIDGAIIPVSRRYREELERRIGDYLV